MSYPKYLKICVALAATSALAGCFGNGNGGGTPKGGGPKTLAAYDTEFNRVSGVAPTSDMPTRLQASYSGALKVDVADATVRGQMLGDLDLDVDWTDGQTASAVTGGSITNVQMSSGTGPLEAVAGTLTVLPNAPATPNLIARVSTPLGIAIPGAPTSIETGTMLVSLGGQLSANGETADAIIGLQGTFFGPGAEGAIGPAVGGLANSSSVGTGGLLDNGSLGGSFYVER